MAAAVLRSLTAQVWSGLAFLITLSPSHPSLSCIRDKSNDGRTSFLTLVLCLVYIQPRLVCLLNTLYEQVQEKQSFNLVDYYSHPALCTEALRGVV